MRLAAVASEICEILRNSLKIQTYGVQVHLMGYNSIADITGLSSFV